MYNTNFIKYIDINKIISEGNSPVLRKLPRFIINIMAKIIRQNDMNQILNKLSDDKGIHFLPKMIEEFNLTLDIEGLENLPENGKCFFTANHPFGIIDGLIITYIVSNKYGDIKAIGNDAFMFIHQLRPLIAAVNVFGKSSKEYIKALDLVYNSNVPITHFPAGEVSRKYERKVEDTVWQKSFITKSISSQRDIVPIHFHGTNSILFYFIHKVRKTLGIKVNLELLLLPREMFKKRNKTIKISIGKPISHKLFNTDYNHFQWAQKVREYIYSLNNKTINNNFL